MWLQLLYTVLGTLAMVCIYCLVDMNRRVPKPTIVAKIKHNVPWFAAYFAGLNVWVGVIKHALM